MFLPGLPMADEAWARSLEGILVSVKNPTPPSAARAAPVRPTQTQTQTSPPTSTLERRPPPASHDDPLVREFAESLTLNRDAPNEDAAAHALRRAMIRVLEERRTMERELAERRLAEGRLEDDLVRELHKLCAERTETLEEYAIRTRPSLLESLLRIAGPPLRPSPPPPPPRDVPRLTDPGSDRERCYEHLNDYGNVVHDDW